MKIKTNIQRFEYRELCKTITKTMSGDIRKHNKRLVESAVRNRKSLREIKENMIQ